MHQPIPPVILLGLAATGVVPSILFVGGMAWLSHIVIGWAIGDGAPVALRRNGSRGSIQSNHLKSRWPKRRRGDG
jgi:hypothetical protein